jgi:fatty acid desaturase
MGPLSRERRWFSRVSLVEHHGLWQQHNTNLQTQLYASRNIRCSAWFNALMGGLPHHSAHHAFPWLCSTRLPEGSARIAAVLARHGVAPTPLADSYAAALQLLRPTDAPCSQSSPGSG